MAIEKRNDGSLCWTYIGRWNRTHCRILLLIWLMMMLLLFSCMGIAAAVAGLPHDMNQVLLRLALGMGGVVTVIFALIWLWERFAKKQYSYTVDEKKLTVAYGRFRYLPFEQIKTMIGQRERNAIILKSFLIPTEIFVSAGDYDRVWDYLTAHCPNSRIQQ